MSIFNNLFDKNKTNSELPSINWITINHLNQIDLIVEESNEIPVVIFKHSTRCIVSKTVLKNFEKEYQYDKNFKLYFLDLLQYRQISNEIATQLHVIHQSPQLILLKNGEVVYHASHDNIEAEVLKKWL